MKARLYVVDKISIKDTIDSKQLSIRVPNPGGKLWDKTMIDIMADLFQIEIGDYVFLWESGCGGKIYGVYRIVSKPFYNYVAGETAPFKIKIDEAYHFENCINEYDIINNPNYKNNLWNIIGKKVAGKSRASTPLTSVEMGILIQSLINKNPDYTFIKPQKEVPIKNEIFIDLNGEYTDNKIKSLSEFNPLKQYHRIGSSVKYEKSLEAIFNKLHRDKDSIILSQIGIDINKVVWFANYLPYGIERSEIDYMSFESDDGANITKINVIEFQKDDLDIGHIDKVLLYSKWVKDVIAHGNCIVRAILICGPNSNLAKENKASKYIKDNKLHNNLDIYKYEINSTRNCIEFTKLL